MEWNWPPDFETAAPPKWDTMGHPNTQYKSIQYLCIIWIYLNYVIYLPHKGMNCTGPKWMKIRGRGRAAFGKVYAVRSSSGQMWVIGGCCIARKASLKCEHLFWHEIQQEWHSNRTFSLWSRSWHNVWGLPNQLKPQISTNHCLVLYKFWTFLHHYHMTGASFSSELEQS